ncbi:hypothetical protein [Haloarcula halophila]|uniref:hypothetical protein n=1 Tax=Haloarcula TaxID=2237 RepID=UPI0036235F15
MFESVAVIEEGKLCLRAEFASEYYPGETAAWVEIRWYRNDDFNFQYQEEREDGVWKCRWDRHPSSHNSRDHFHPSPNASRSDATDAQWPVDHRDMCRLVLGRVEERIESLWERQ